MQKLPIILRLPFHFDEYRKQKIFLDCTYTINQKVYNAHKIILSKFSKLYLDYFSKNFTSEAPIPFGADYFNFMVDFFYTRTLHLPPNNPDNLVFYLGMSVVYDADKLYEIISPIINEFLTSDKNIKIVLKLTSQFKNLQLYPDESKLFDNINDNFNRFVKEQKRFVPFIIEHYDVITAKNMDDLFQSVTPFLLSKILKKKHFSNEENAKIIDNYTSTISITEKDKKYLQSVINWNENNVYLLFLDNRMDWVSPSISRKYYDMMLEARSNSSQSFLDISQKLCGKNKSVNNWWIIQQTQFIHSSVIEKEAPDIEALHFISTIGNVNDNYYNPILYNLIDSNCSKNLPDAENFGIQEIFSDDPQTYYLSYPSEKEPNPFIEISFLKATFDINRIVVESVLQKMAPNILRFIFDDISYDTINTNDRIAELITKKPVKVNKIMIKMADPIALSLRVKSLKIFGKFNCDVFK